MSEVRAADDATNGGGPAPGRPPRRIGLPRDRRAVAATAGAIAVLLVAAAVAVPLLGDDGGDGGGSVTEARGCTTPPRIAPVALAAGGSWESLSVPSVRPCATLTATKAGPGGVDLTSSFLLTSREPLDAEDVERRLVVDPPVALSVEAEDGGGGGARLRVDPAQPLTEDAVYRFALLDGEGGEAVEQWSFQAAGRLRAVQTHPADGATGVPADTGIELTFSHDGVQGVQERFRIEPTVAGRFETSRRTVVFVPERKLAPGALYTVTLAAGAAVPGGEAIAADTVFRFETATTTPVAWPPSLMLNRSFWEARTGEAPVLGLFRRPDAPSVETVHVAVQRFAGTERFLASLDRYAAIPPWALLTRAAYVAPADGLADVAAFDARLEAAGPGGEVVLRFPEALPAGTYLARLDVPGAAQQAWLQVTDLAVYAAVSERRSLVWAQDLRAGAPAGGATVRIAGSEAFSVVTGSDGVALFDNPAGLLATDDGALGVETQGAANLLVSLDGVGSAVVPLAATLPGTSSLEYRAFDFEGDPSGYWRFLYADRSLYRPTDTVRVWGLVRAREGAAAEGPVVLDVAGYDDEGRAVEVARGSAPLGTTGTFLGDVRLRGVTPGYYTLRARIGRQTVSSTSLEVRDFVKPAYTLDVTPSARAVFAGADVRYDVRATFPEGTPVPGVRLRVEGPAYEQVEEVTTDGSGRASVTRPAGVQGTPGGQVFDRVSVTPAVGEEADIAGAADVTVLPGAVLVAGRAERRGDQAVVTGEAFAADLSRSATDDVEPFQAFRGAPAPRRTVDAQLVETVYRRVETGRYYDFVAKAVVPTYRYETEERAAGTRSAVTDDAGRFEIAFPAAGESAFRVVLSVADDAGRTTRQEVYVNTFLDAPDAPLHLVGDGKESYRVGDEVAVALEGGRAAPAGAASRYLFVTAKTAIRSYTVRQEPEHRFTFGEQDVPDVTVFAVRFAGSTFEEAWGMPAMFDRESRRLDVELTPDAARHRPGEQARVDVRVTDAAGAPVEGAEVVLSAVDERIHQLQPWEVAQREDILGRLYEPVGAAVLGTYGTHAGRDLPSRDGAETGEGGELRSDFRDAALFTTVRTGADGRASAPFALPSDLTSWRMTAVAVTPDLRAGAGNLLLPVGLPLFADVAMNDSYLVADRPVARLRAFGESLAAGDAVAFRVESSTLLDRPLEATGTAFEPAAVPLPPLRAGRHEVTFRVTAGSRSDALVRTLVVVPSRLVRTETSVAEVAAGSTWDPGGAAPSGARVVISDHNRGRWYPTLAALAAGGGDRVERAVARDRAQALLAEQFGEPLDVATAFRGAAYQTTDGGVAVLPFADDDLAVTARVAAVAPDAFARTDMARYLRAVLDDADETRERAVAALSGLAALGEPVLTAVQAVAALDDLTPRERLHAGLAAAGLGDDATARALYRRVLEEYGKGRGETARLEVGDDEDDVVEATALAATLGAQLADGHAPALASYVAQADPRAVVVDLEQVAFLAAALPRLAAEPVRVTYQWGDGRTEQQLERGRSIVVAVPDDGLGTLDLRVEQGTAGVVRSALVAVDPATITADPGLRLERTIQPASGKAGAPISSSDLVRVELRAKLGAKAADGCYQVSDLLPSGLRPVTAPYRRVVQGDTAARGPHLIEGQRVSFCAFRNDATPIAYYARVVSPGSYVAEPALLQAPGDPGRVAVTGAVPVEIR